MFSKKGVLENFAKLTENYLFASPTRVFYCQFYEVFENTSGRLLLMKTPDGQKFELRVAYFS